MRPHLLLLVLVVALAGCGGGDDGGGTTAGGGGGTTEGKAVFDSAGCGGCHTFSAAGSNGSVGPNLDDANVTFEQAKQQVTNGGGGMPSFKGDLSEEEIDAVARFVSGEGGGSSSGAGSGTSAIAPFSR